MGQGCYWMDRTKDPPVFAIHDGEQWVVVTEAEYLAAMGQPTGNSGEQAESVEGES